MENTLCFESIRIYRVAHWWSVSYGRSQAHEEERFYILPIIPKSYLLLVVLHWSYLALACYRYTDIFCNLGGLCQNLLLVMLHWSYLLLLTTAIRRYFESLANIAKTYLLVQLDKSYLPLLGFATARTLLDPIWFKPNQHFFFVFDLDKHWGGLIF